MAASSRLKNAALAPMPLTGKKPCENSRLTGPSSRIYLRFGAWMSLAAVRPLFTRAKYQNHISGSTGLR